MKSKGKLLFFLAGCLFILAGWSQKKVELLNDKKLIDLNLAIGKCTLGAEDLISTEGDNAQETNSPTTAPKPVLSVTPKPTQGLTPTPRPTATPKPTQPPLLKPRTLNITIRDQQVTYNNVVWTDLEILRAQLQKDHDERTTFRLVDDFAEAHAYRQMLEILNELETEIGLRYIKSDSVN